MKDIISNQMMRDADRYTIDTLGISGEELMMRASKAVREEIDRDNVAIIVGKGNNGGDGICLAKILIDEGKTPDVYMFSRECKGESLYYYNMIKDYANIYMIDGKEDYSHYDIVVDCIFGTGLARDVEGIYKDTIDNINKSHAYVISVDIPSGLNGDNGNVNNVAVFANKTVSINTRKLGQYLQNGKDYTGEIVSKDIGIKLVSKPYHLLEDADIIIPKRLNNSHKGTYGSVALIGGSINYMGAIKLSYMGINALTSGAGLVRLCVPREYVSVYGESVIECTLYPMTSKDGKITFDKSELDGIMDMRVIAIGMGIGDSEENMKILRYLLDNYNNKLLIDADGLNALAKDIDMLKGHKAEVVLTPHVGEMSRLCKMSTKGILANPVDIAVDFAKKYNVKLLLKGISTIVTDGEEVYIVDRGAPSMAKAGSGDVLSGIIAGLLANSNIDTLDAVYMGSYIAGVAGEMARDEYGDNGTLARDTARFTSYAVKKYTK